MNWTDISISKYNELKDILLDPDIEEEDRIMYEVQILFGDDPYKMSLSDLKDRLSQLAFLGKDVPKMKIQDKYILGGTTYELHRKLDDFTVAQWIDWQNFLKKGADTDNYANLLSVFFFPVGKREYGEDYDLEKVRKDINEHLSVADGLSISGFFLTYHKALLVRSLSYTRRLTLKTATPLKRKERRKIRKEYRKAIMEIIRGD